MTLVACNHEKYIFGSETRNIIIDRIMNIVNPRVDEFDAIAVSGYSSSIISTIIADKLNKNVLLIRKSSDIRHSNFKVEGFKNQRVLFIDDCVDSGDTLNRVRRGCTTHNCTLVGLVLYNDSCPYDESWGGFNSNNIIDYPSSEGSNWEDEEVQDTNYNPWEIEQPVLSEGWTT